MTRKGGFGRWLGKPPKSVGSKKSLSAAVGSERRLPLLTRKGSYDCWPGKSLRLVAPVAARAGPQRRCCQCCRSPVVPGFLALASAPVLRCAADSLGCWAAPAPAPPLQRALPAPAAPPAGAPPVCSAALAQQVGVLLVATRCGGASPLPSRRRRSGSAEAARRREGTTPDSAGPAAQRRVLLSLSSVGNPWQHLLSNMPIF